MKGWVTKMDSTRSKLHDLKSRKPQPAHSARQSKRRKQTSSRYLGVSYISATKKWRATIFINGKSIILGSYDSEEYAARVRDGAVLYYLGNGAMLNLPNETPVPYIPKRDTEQELKDALSAASTEASNRDEELRQIEAELGITPCAKRPRFGAIISAIRLLKSEAGK